MIAIITVYKEKEHLKGIIDELLNQNIKGIIVEVDKPNKELAKLIKNYEKILKNKKVKNEVKIYEINKKRKRIKIKIIKGRIKKSKVIFIISKERRGKVNCLNEASKIAKDNKLLFLDNDVIIKFDIKEIDKLLNKYDFIDVKKEVNTKGKFKEKLLRNLQYYEYSLYGIISYSLIKLANSPWNINGACFAIRKELLKKLNYFKQVITEDTDLTLRAIGKAKFHYYYKGKAVTEVPTNFREWLKQKTRWLLGGMQCLSGIEALKLIIKKHSLILAVAFYTSPIIALILSSTILKSKELILTSGIIALLSSIFPHLLTYFSSLSSLLLFNFPLTGALYFAIMSLIVFILSKKLKFKFNIVYFFLFIYVYLFLWCIPGINALIKLFGKKKLKDWKV